MSHRRHYWPKAPIGRVKTSLQSPAPTTSADYAALGALSSDGRPEFGFEPERMAADAVCIASSSAAQFPDIGPITAISGAISPFRSMRSGDLSAISANFSPVGSHAGFRGTGNSNSLMRRESATAPASGAASSRSVRRMVMVYH